jgi:hypothetical protein
MRDIFSLPRPFFSLPRSRARVGVRAAQPVLLLALACLLLAACGRTGDIRAPGPPERITFPRVYPAPDRAPQPQPVARP